MTSFSDRSDRYSDERTSSSEGESSEWVSKSQRKRDAEALQELGVSLMDLKASELARCPINSETREAILLCKTIRSFPALKRQKQLIGKLMRKEDPRAIITFLSTLSGRAIPASFQPDASTFSEITLSKSGVDSNGEEEAAQADSISVPKPLELKLSPEAGFSATGQGPELLLMHGWTGASVDFDPIVERLAPHATVIRWDARPYYSDLVSIAQMAADVETIIRTRCLTRPILLGHSMGALVAFEYLKNYGSDLLSGLAIVDMTPCMITREGWPLALYGHYTEADNQQFIDELEADFVERVCHLILSGKKMSGDQKKAFMRMDFSRIREARLNGLNPKAWIECWQDFVVRDYRDVLAKIDLPTLLLYGEKSNFYGPDVAHYMQASISDSELTLFSGAGHSPQVEQPDLFAEKLIRFIEKVSAMNSP
jgi:non-heme chloroperoxidase